MKKKKNKAPYIIIMAAAGVLWALVIVMIVVLGVPDKVNAARVGKQIDLGNKYLAEANYDKAEVKFAKALKISPKSSKAATGMAKVYNKKKQPEKAVKYLRKASANVTDGEEAREIQLASKETRSQLAVQNKTTYNLELNQIDQTVNTVINHTDNTVIVVKKDPTVTPTPEEKGDPGRDRGGDDGDVHIGKVTISPAPGVTGDPTVTAEPTITEEPIVQIIDPTGEPIITGEPNPTEDPSEEPTVTETPETGDDAEETSDPGEDTDTGDNAGDTEVDGIPVAREDGEDTTETGETTENGEDPETGESSGTDETPSGTGDLLEDYVNNTLAKELPSVSWADTQIPFIYGETSASTLTGRLAETRGDLDGDGEEELLVVEVKSGSLGFRIYKEENGTVELKTSQMTSTGMKTPMESLSYGNTQDCFLMNYQGKVEIGFATWCYGYDSGEETPEAVTAVEVYQVEADDSVTLCASGSVTNGQGQDSLAASLQPSGLTGGWNSSNAEALQARGYAENPYQDLSDIPDPLGDGLSGAEGCTDLAVLTVKMPAGSGTLTAKSK